MIRAPNKMSPPMMIGKDATGERVSLLNEEHSEQSTPRAQEHPRLEHGIGERISSPFGIGGQMHILLRQNELPPFRPRCESGSDNSSPTGNLSRHSSWTAFEASTSPTTPMSPGDSQQSYHPSYHSSPTLFQNTFSHASSPAAYQYRPSHGPASFCQPSYPSSSNSSPSLAHQSSYSASGGSYFGHPHTRPSNPHQEARKGSEAVAVKIEKRYPCRYATEHNCDKTFTTSGHASRHSKIHTAEKAVQCVHPGCNKKFTRSDNMKQHLETHKREKKRSTDHGVSKRCLTPRPGRPPSGDFSRPGAMDVLADVAAQRR